MSDLVDIKELKKVDVVQIIRNAKTLNEAVVAMNGLAANGHLTLWNNATHKDGTSYRDLITNAPTVQREGWVSVDELQKVYDDMFSHKDIAMVAQSLWILIHAK